MKNKLPAVKPCCFGEVVLNRLPECEQCPSELWCIDTATYAMWQRRTDDEPEEGHYRFNVPIMVKAERNRLHQGRHRERRRAMLEPKKLRAEDKMPAVERRLQSQLAALDAFIATASAEQSELAQDAIRFRDDLAAMWAAKISYFIDKRKLPGRIRLTQLLEQAGFPMAPATVGRRMTLSKQLAPFLNSLRTAQTGEDPPTS
jgi:hypothetical protein